MIFSIKNILIATLFITISFGIISVSWLSSYDKEIGYQRELTGVTAEISNDSVSLLVLSSEIVEAPSKRVETQLNTLLTRMKKSSVSQVPNKLETTRFSDLNVKLELIRRLIVKFKSKGHLKKSRRQTMLKLLIVVQRYVALAKLLHQESLKKVEQLNQRKTVGLIVILSALFIFLATGLICLMTLISRPVASFVSSLEAIGSGQLDAPMNRPRIAEFWQIAAAIDSMRQKLIIAERRKFQAAKLQLAKHRAEEANEAKSLFLSNMSHELRTPLNAVIGFTEIIEEDLEHMSKSEIRQDIEKILTSARFLLILVNDILDITKIEAGKLELCYEMTDVHYLLEEISTSTETLVAQNNNRLEMKCDVPNLKMSVDAQRLRQVLLNLLGNSSKFTSNGTITLKVGLNKEQETVQFSIIDSGIGMTPTQLEHIFDRFSQADPIIGQTYGGTGLGLTLVQRFVQLLKGRIEVNSELGVGSTFTVTLPQQPKEEAPRIEAKDYGAVQLSSQLTEQIQAMNE